MEAYVGEALLFTALFIESKVGKTGLTVTVDVYRNGVKVIDNQAATEQAGGLYSYDLASGSNNAAGRYTAIFKTATSTVDQQQVASHFIVRAAMGPLLADSITSAALAASAVSEIAAGVAAPSASDIATAVANALDIPTANENAAALLGTTLDGALTMTQGLRAMLAVLTGVTDDNAGTVTVKRRDGVTTAWTWTVNSANGERTASTPGTL